MMQNEIGTSKLIVEPSRGIAGEPIPLGLSLRGQINDAIVVISGLLPGMELSACNAVDGDTWQLPASVLPDVWVAPPRAFIGSATLVAELRLPNNAQIADRQALHVEWMRPAPAGHEEVGKRSQRNGARRHCLNASTTVQRPNVLTAPPAISQYCGQLGKQDNCQVAVSLSLANRHASLPVAYQLYLPQDWAEDRERRRKAHVPEEIEFATKPEIALEQLRWACAAGLPRGVALFDAGYGNNSAFRSEVTALGLTYVAGIVPTTTVWAPGTAPLPPKRWSGRGRRPTRLRRDAKHRPVTVKELALSLCRRAWRTIEWREGSAEPLVSRFARLRIRIAHHDEQRRDGSHPAGGCEPSNDHPWSV